MYTRPSCEQPIRVVMHDGRENMRVHDHRENSLYALWHTTVVRIAPPKSFRGRLLQDRWPNQQCQSTEGTSWSSRSGLNPTRIIPPCYQNTTPGNHIYTQRKGPNVTNPICLTCKNCLYKCAADCEHYVTQSSTAILICGCYSHDRRVWQVDNANRLFSWWSRPSWE